MDEGIKLRADGQDPNIVISLEHSVRLRGRRAYLWGQYQAAEPGTLQAFLPEPGSGQFSESNSAATSYKAGRGAFSVALPFAEALTTLRLDPFQGPGEMVLQRLELVVVESAKSSHPTGASQLQTVNGVTFVPRAPKLDRFQRVPLLAGGEVPMLERCKARYDGAVLVVDELERGANLTFLLDHPIESQDGVVFLAGSVSVDVGGELEFSAPEPAGEGTNWRETGSVRLISTSSFLAPLAIERALRVLRVGLDGISGGVKFEQLEALVLKTA
jgi:hypothetical protein